MRGDRDGPDVDSLAERRFDAVFDTCGFVPRVVARSARALASSGRYLFISSISAYRDPLGGRLDEDEPLATLDDPSVETVTGETYGGLKALCERSVTEAFGSRACIVRPGLIVGPGDPTGRFTYWPVRFAEGGEALVPGKPDRPISCIDVRDLAAWLVHAAEAGLGGAFNAAGDPDTATMRDLVDACAAAAQTPAKACWVPDTFLLEHGVTPWMDLPLWLPAGEDSLLRASTVRARAAGLQLRSLHETAADTLAWARTSEAKRAAKAGLSPERERALLDAWQTRSGP